VTIEASGVFSDEGTLAVPIGDPRTITFTFTRGNLVVLNALPALPAAPCV
jgi:hypothetical protein